MNQTEQPKQPFFARFMETQNKQTSHEERLNAASFTGEPDEVALTLKFPSDREDPGPNPDW